MSNIECLPGYGPQDTIPDKAARIKVGLELIGDGFKMVISANSCHGSSPYNAVIKESHGDIRTNLGEDVETIVGPAMYVVEDKTLSNGRVSKGGLFAPEGAAIWVRQKPDQA